ncbi:MAG: hypothetical protein ACI9KE_001417 [Polyangiales bacterium]|jgi:hypothetical protein
MWIGIGVGCLLLSIITCVGSWYWCKSKAEGFVEGAGEMVGEFSRITLSMSLSTIKAGCASDPSGAGAVTHFHPAAFPAYQAVACQVTDQTLAAIRNSCTPGNGVAQTPCSNVMSATAAGDAGRAAGVGVDANSCFSYTSGTMRIVACNIDGQGLKIIHLENPAGVQ